MFTIVGLTNKSLNKLYLFLLMGFKYLSCLFGPSYMELLQMEWSLLTVLSYYRNNQDFFSSRWKMFECGSNDITGMHWLKQSTCVDVLQECSGHIFFFGSTKVHTLLLIIADFSILWWECLLTRQTSISFATVIHITMHCKIEQWGCDYSVFHVLFLFYLCSKSTPV